MVHKVRFAGSLVLSLAAALMFPVTGISQERTEPELWRRLPDVRGYLDSARDSGFSGVVLVGRGDEVVLHEAYGFAQVELGVAMRTDHLFRIGSLTKPITASGVLAAVNRGRLSLDAQVCEPLPACPPSWHGVTLRHLLSHTSGIPDHFGDLEAVPVDSTARELYRVLAGLGADEAALTSPPGTAYDYRNFNYVLAGVLLERAMGMPWEQALRGLVFEPLGLRSMAYDDVYTIVPQRVRGYARDDDGRLRNTEYDDHGAYAAGGLLSNASDLFRWSRGMLTAKLFRAELVRESLTPVQGDYGLGWQVRRFFDRRIYNHTGGIDGFSSHLAHYPDQDLTLVVLTNDENDSAILRACDLAALLFAWPSPGERAQLTPRQRCGVEPA